VTGNQIRYENKYNRNSVCNLFKLESTERRYRDNDVWFGVDQSHQRVWDRDGWSTSMDCQNWPVLYLSYGGSSEDILTPR
jgi:hypothetical protein